MKGISRKLISIILFLFLFTTMPYIQDTALAKNIDNFDSGRTVSLSSSNSGRWSFLDSFLQPKPGNPPIPQVDKTIGKAISERDRPSAFRNEKPCICEGTIEVCARMCGDGVGSGRFELGE